MGSALASKALSWSTSSRRVVESLSGSHLPPGYRWLRNRTLRVVIEPMGLNDRLFDEITQIYDNAVRRARYRVRQDQEQGPREQKHYCKAEK